MFEVGNLKVKFWYDIDELMDTPARLTFCRIEDTLLGVEIGEGIAIPHYKDNFSKKVGRKIALARALDDAGLGKEVRTSIWNKYFEMVKK